MNAKVGMNHPHSPTCGWCADGIWRDEMSADVVLEENLTGAGATFETEWDDNVRTFTRGSNTITVTVTHEDNTPAGWHFDLHTDGIDRGELEARFCQLDQVIYSLIEHLATRRADPPHAQVLLESGH